MLKQKQSRSILITKRVFSYILLVSISLICIFLFYILFINSTRFNPDIRRGFSFLPGKALMYNLDNLLAIEYLPVARAVINSLYISTLVAILATYFSCLTAYGIHMYKFRFKRAAFIFIMIVMMVPAQVSTLGFLDLIADLKLMDTYTPLIVPSIASPIIFYFMKQYLEATLPFEIVESARVDGSSEIRTFHQIVLPIMKPAIAVQAIFAFVSSWNNLFIPSLVIYSKDKKTVPLVIGMLRSMDDKTDLGMIYLMVAIAVIPLIIIYIFLSKFIIKGITIGSVKG